VIARTWESIKENIKTRAKESFGLHELMYRKERFVEEGLRCLAQRKQAKMQWVQGPNQSTVDNLNDIRRDTSRNCGNKRNLHTKTNIDLTENTIRYKIVTDLYMGIIILKRFTSLEII
jgi:hypothetical protein